MGRGTTKEETRECLQRYIKKATVYSPNKFISFISLLRTLLSEKLFNNDPS